ncbi:MAG TPA: DEAD/DEAH box helicase [Phycisphaerales bacterium]|nr:DEAD/DEAH box helicase [Phycisphaerales bacterium]
MSFEDLRLSEPLRRSIAAEGYTIPTPIQAKAIPHILEGRDLLGCAQTGTGKTAAFAWPILQLLSTGKLPPVSATAKNDSHGAVHPHGHGHGREAGPKHAQGNSGKHGKFRSPRALVLCPTRELASQITESFTVYGAHLRLRVLAIFGGVSQHQQVRALSNGVDIVVATPGRLLDLKNQGFVDLKDISILALDEADHMLDMGFIPDIRKIVKALPTKRQTLMFSATMPSEIRHLADSILHSAVEISVAPQATTVETVSQRCYHVSSGNKPALLTYLLQNGMADRTVVFTRTKHRADKVVKALVRAGIRAEAIHGNKSQNHRTRSLNSFKSANPPVLVATDIAARGIDVDDVTHVINFDLPNVPETYVHRIGRTARAGASGEAVSFCDENEHGLLRDIQRLTGQRIPTAEVEHGKLQKNPDGEVGWNVGERSRSIQSRGGQQSKHGKPSEPRVDRDDNSTRKTRGWSKRAEKPDRAGHHKQNAGSQHRPMIDERADHRRGQHSSQPRDDQSERAPKSGRRRRRRPSRGHFGHKAAAARR